MFAACSKDNGGGGEPDDNNPTTQHALGWNKSSDDLSKYPKEISFKFTSSGSSANLPSSVDLTGKLPPVGNQGNYGTCVAWSVAYGLRTYLDAASRNLSAQQLADPSNQYSPADLWMAMATADKAADCGGSNFEPALNLLVNRGVATLKTAPYSSLQCGGTPQQTWTADAANRKILNYRMIAEADMTVENLKTHLAQGQAMSFGARLGDNFMAWNGTGVLSSETYNQPNMQHAYHALVLAGYDDSKGANGAFLVYNSWGTDWGNAGKIWVDYKFFLENFVFAAFVATPDNNVNPNDDNRIDPNDLSSGTDLAAYHAYDVGGNFGGGYNRQLYFNIYNAGSTPVASSRRYSIVYIYYNAFDANDYGVLTDLYITDQIPRNTIQQSQRPVEGYCSFDVNMDIPAGTSIASAFFGNNYEYTYMTYYMPNTLNGYYYFVLMADPYNNVSETNEQNNLFFIADPNGYPYYVMNGMPQTRAGETHAAAALPPFGRTTRNAELAPTHSLVPQNRNAYTPDEIRALIRDRKASGELDKRIREFDATRKAPEIGGK
jgi:C1A family cysteine protease